MNGEQHPDRVRVLIPWGHWTPVRGEVFNTFPSLARNRAPGLFLQMYDLGWHKPQGVFEANMSDLANRFACGYRTLELCLEELLDRGLVEQIRKGVLRSRTDKPVWRVPLTNFKLSVGNWVPVPRFLITHYLPRFSDSLLLVILLRLQHTQWLNYCWPGARYLAQVTGWSKRKVYRGLRLMGHEHVWQKLGTGLPWPLQIIPHTNSRGQDRRHFRNRAVFYKKKKRGRSLVMLTEEFAEHFGIKRGRPLNLNFKS